MTPSQEPSYEEIAQRMRIPLGTVRSRLSRARDMFKRHLSEKGYEVKAAA